MQVRALKGIRLPGSQLIYCIIFLYSIKDYLAICLLVVIICNIWLSYWSPAPSTTPLPISEPHSKIVRMNKLLDKEQAAAVDMTWHDISALLNWTWISFFAGSFIITRDTDTNPWTAGLDGSDKKLSIAMVLEWTTVFYQILITYSTAQHSSSYWSGTHPHKAW